MPVVALLAWTYLKVGSVTRAQALREEQGIRTLHAAEAGIRSYLATGQIGPMELNDCQVKILVSDTKVVCSAYPIRGRHKTSVTLWVESGFVMRRTTNDEN
jgi:hypothetical protein